MATALRDYELVYVLSPDLADDVVTVSIDRVQQAITSGGGEIVDVNHWGRRRLAYPIDRHFEGNYVVSQIRLDPGSVPALDSSLRIAEDVIRHLIIRSGE